jgi:hypothetical protein
VLKITLLPQSPEVRKSGAKRLNVVMPVKIKYGRRKNEWLLGTVVVPFTKKDAAEDFAERVYEEARDGG